jgi:hypothetical protein
LWLFHVTIINNLKKKEKMSARNISIINSPLRDHEDAVLTNGSMSITGLSPFRTSTLQSLQVQRNLVETPQIWVVTLIAGVANTLAFDVQQTVNSLLTNLTFSMPNTTSTTAADVIANINAFFGNAATNGGGFVSSASPSRLQVSYSVSVSATTNVALTIKGASGNPFVGVSQVADTPVTVASGMSTLVLDTQLNVATEEVLFKTTVAHGLVTGSTLRVGVLTGQTMFNNGVWRVIYKSATTFSLVDPVTATPVLATVVTTAGGAAGTLTRVAQPDFGSPEFVNADAALNGSSDTVTATTYNFSAVDITPHYTSDVAPNPAMRTAPCRVWIPEVLIASPYTASADGQGLTDYLVDYIV